MESAPEASFPFVETSIARFMRSRLSITHERRGICVISGPWGIGKTRAIDRFVQDEDFGCVVVKIEPGTSKRGVSQVTAMQFAFDALAQQSAAQGRAIYKRGYWNARRIIADTLEDYLVTHYGNDRDLARFTFIFDEAQYLSREAIEMLRYWNDEDRPSLPFPVGLVFVGNNEFALQEDGSGESVISGAVRSRLLFQEQLQYANIDDVDLTLFLQSRGVTDASALKALLAYYSRAGARRDFRVIERNIALLRDMAGDGAVTSDLVQSLFSL